jgi:2,4-dienoyl-CoA reductase-like NADH-dependent reductase (Old Yellow Enzyme family)
MSWLIRTPTRGMTRAHMADPHIVWKIIEGREDDIRPCVGANYCLRPNIYLPPLWKPLPVGF